MERNDAWDYTRDESLRLVALLIFGIAFVAGAVWAVVQTVRGFVEGVLEARDRHLERNQAAETPFPDRPRPAARPVPGKNYTVELQGDSEVLLNGVQIGYIASGPWQFCSYTEPPAPARESKARAFDDACDYAESVVRSA